MEAICKKIYVRENIAVKGLIHIVGLKMRQGKIHELGSTTLHDKKVGERNAMETYCWIKLEKKTMINKSKKNL